MDGGSLQDLVDRGGCEDEQVLADIAHQVSGPRKRIRRKEENDMGLALNIYYFCGCVLASVCRTMYVDPVTSRNF